jgi:hypothetical protein
LARVGKAQKLLERPEDFPRPARRGGAGRFEARRLLKKSGHALISIEWKPRQHFNAPNFQQHPTTVRHESQ